jgi:hypothetical protein
MVACRYAGPRLSRLSYDGLSIEPITLDLKLKP